MRGESARRAVTRGEDLLTGGDRVDGGRYQVGTVGAEEVLRNVGSGAGSLELQVSLAAVGCCRAVWRQLVAAEPSGGELWPLQVSLAAIGCCRAVQGRCTRPSFNGAAAVEHSLCYLQVMLLLF